MANVGVRDLTDCGGGTGSPRTKNREGGVEPLARSDASPPTLPVAEACPESTTTSRWLFRAA
jgi:hypothetical protein